MSDTLNAPEDKAKEFDTWLHEQDGAHVAHRMRGVTVLSKFRGKEPLTDKESEVVERVIKNRETAEAQYLEMLGEAQFTDAFERDKILIESIGTELTPLEEDEQYPEGDVS